MNGKAAKGIRRDIRRAVGADALDVVNQQSHVLNKAVPEIGRLRERVAALEGQAEAFDCRLESTKFIAIDAHALLRAHRELTFLGRLRWLLGF